MNTYNQEFLKLYKEKKNSLVYIKKHTYLTLSKLVHTPWIRQFMQEQI